jgi:ABC-type transport system involved in multi-copper enzyme maturation permease subunit
VSAVWHIARREWLEQRRQPVMLGAITLLYGIITTLVVATVALLQMLVTRPNLAEQVVAPGEALEPGLAAIVGSVLGLWNFLLFTQFLGIAGVLSGHAVLHDRQCGTLTFLLLAPVRRLPLLTGKVLGAIGWPVVLYLGAAIVGGVLASLFPLARTHLALVPLSAVWWTATLLTAPLWALCIGGVCTLISSLAHDVRTAQQGVWFVLFFATLATGGLLTWSLTQGVATQLGVSALALAGAAGTLFSGAQVISRDLGR